MCIQNIRLEKVQGGFNMSFLLDEFLEYLAEDGEWHSLKEIVAAIHLDEDKVKKIIRFFARYGFVQFNKAQNKVKIEPQLREIVLSSMPVEERVPVIIIKKRMS